PAQTTFAYYLFGVIPPGLGWGAYALVLVTIGVWIAKGRKQELSLFTYPVLYVAIISSWEMRAERYLLPIIPILHIVTACGVGELVEIIRKKSVRLAPLLATVVLMLLAAQPVAAIYNIEKTISLPDTRFAVEEWTKKHLRVGSAIAIGPFGIFFPEKAYHVLDIPFIPVKTERVSPFYDTRWYEDLDLVVASDYDEARY